MASSLSLVVVAPTVHACASTSSGGRSARGKYRSDGPGKAIAALSRAPNEPRERQTLFRFASD
jgi:hypothetical protein